MSDKPLKPFTKTELAGQFIKEIASGAFTRGDSAAGNAYNIAKRRSNDVLRSTVNPYKNQNK